MPRYDYKCDTCGQIYEVTQRFADAPLTVHEGCGGSVRRLISAPALQFKGAGWYVNDYGRGNSGPKKSESETKSDSKGETKTASKTDGSSTTPAKTESAPAPSSTETKK
jgi:putative FmdB family regulatory protein